MGTENSLPVRLLGLLAGGGIRSLAELARQLDVSEGLVRLMATDLARHGYLAEVGSSCTAACGGCALANACDAVAGQAARPARLELTPKGRLAAGKEFRRPLP